MDAANFSFSRTAFLVSLALLIPASALAQTPQFSVQSSTVTLQGNQSTSDSVSSTTSTNITFNATTAYSNGDPNWLNINNAPSALGLTTPTTLYFIVGQQAGQLTAGTHTATVTLHATDSSGASDTTITVSFTTGSGGTTGSTLTATPTALSTSAATGGTASVSFTLSTTTVSPVGFTIGTSANWITTSLSNGFVSSGNPVTIIATFSGASYSQQTLTGFITVSSSGPALSIPVTFGNGTVVGSSGGGTTTSGSLTLSQNPLPLTYTNGSNIFPSATVTLTGTSGLEFFATAQSTNGWLLVDNNTTIQGNLPSAQLTISAGPQAQSLTPGVTYSGVVNIIASDNSTLQLNVNLTVTGSNTTGLTIAPNPILLTSALNGINATQSALIASTTGGNVSVSISGTGLSVSAPASTSIGAGGTTTVTVTGNPTGLAAQTYIGQLNVTVGSVTQTAQVTFTVGGGSSGGGGVTATIAAAPSQLTFVYQNNSSMTATQQQQVFLAGSGNYTAAVTTNVGSNWLSISSTAGTLPVQYFYVTANATGLAAGQYTGSVTFTNTSTSVTSVVNVTLNVYGSTTIYTVPGDIVFDYIAGTTSATQTQGLYPVASDGSAVAVSAAVSNPSSVTWLTLTSNGLTLSGQAQYSVNVNASNLPNGLYTGYISVTGATGSALSVPVALNVIGSTVSGGTGTLTLSTSALTFQIATNGGATTQQLTVSATNATSFTATASTTNGNNTWLSVSPAGSSVTNTTLTVTANPAGLAAGTYNGNITLVSSTGTQTVPVTLVVGGSTGTSGNISVTANGGTSTTPSLTFTAQSVGASVTAQYLTVSSAAGSSGVTFSAAVTGTSCSWVNLGIVANQQYQTPLNPLNIGVTTTGLAAGTYTCNIVLTPSSGTAVTVPVTLTVIGVPTISVATTALNFSYAAGSATPAAQTVTVTGSGSTAPTFTATATSTPSGWLSVTPSSGTAAIGAPATLSVSVNPSGLVAGTYTGTIAIAAGTGDNGSGNIAVTLVVTAPTPSITSITNGASFLGGPVSPGEIISIFGNQLGPLVPLGPAIDSTTGNLTNTLGNVQVIFSATPAILTYVSSGQINCIVPYEVNGLSTVPVQVKFLSQPSNTVTLNVTQTAPGIFTATGTGTGQGAILNQNSTPNTAGNAAALGSIIQIFMTGEGVTNPSQADGAVTPNATTVPQAKVAVTIGGQPATVVFEGEAPGLVAGVLQLNVMIPPTTPAGAQPLVVTIGTNTSQANLTVSVQ